MSAYYVPTIETKVSIVSAVLTSATLLYVLSLNLRNSALRTLEYWNRKSLTPLLTFVEHEGIEVESPKRVEVLTHHHDLLKKRGKIGLVKLYPKRLISTLDVTIDNANKYVSLYRKVRAEAEDFMGSSYHPRALYIALGSGEIANFDQPTLAKHAAFVATQKESPVFREFVSVGKSLQANFASIKSEIEEFFEENELEPMRPTTFKPYEP